VAKTIRSVDELSHFIRQQRKSIGLSQVELAGASGLGVRFIGDLERGKPTCEIGKTLQVLAMLGIDVQLNPRESINE
jgi:y4mF family transcriptional regulator